MTKTKQTPPGRAAGYTAPDGTKYLGSYAAAEYLGIHHVTFNRHRKRNPIALPAHIIKSGNQLLYKVEDLNRYRAEYLSPQPAEPVAAAT